MKIYYAHSIKGMHQTGERTAIQIIDYLKGLGHQVGSEEFFITDNVLTPSQLYARDIQMIAESDIILANVSNPSLGVGYEIGYAESLGKSIVCFYQSNLPGILSAMISGNPSFVSYKIDRIEELGALLSVAS